MRSSSQIAWVVDKKCHFTRRERSKQHLKASFKSNESLLLVMRLSETRCAV